MVKIRTAWRSNKTQPSKISAIRVEPLIRNSQNLEYHRSPMIGIQDCVSSSKTQQSILDDIKGIHQYKKALSSEETRAMQPLPLAHSEIMLLRSYQQLEQLDKQAQGDVEDISDSMHQFQSRTELLVEDIDLQWQNLSRSLQTNTEKDTMLSLYQEKLSVVGKQMQVCKSTLQSAHYIGVLAMLPDMVKTLRQTEHYLQSLYIGRYTFDLGIYNGFSSETAELLHNFKIYSNPLGFRMRETDTQDKQQAPNKLIKRPSAEALGKSGLYNTELDGSPKTGSSNQNNNNANGDVEELTL